MLRNRLKEARKKNVRNIRNRRNRNEFIVNSDEDDSASDGWESAPGMGELDSDEETSSDNVSSTRRRLVRGTNKPKTKRYGLRRNPVSNASINVNEAGPSGSSSTSNCSRVGLKNGTTAKRKLKERKQGILDSDSSSDDIFGGNARRSNIKRPRTSDLDSDDSDSSGIQPVSSSSQRLSLFSSDSSSYSGEIGAPMRGRNFRARINIWSDSESSNTLDQSSHSPIFNTARFRAGTSGTSLGTSLGNLLSIRLMDPIASSSSMSSASSSSSSSTSNSSSSTFTTNSTYGEVPDHFMDRTAANVRSPVVSTVAMQEQLISSDSDSSDSDGEKCAICLKKFRRQRVGNPSNCDHKFCVTCIQEWSKSSTTCPVDRSVFDAIIVRNEIDGPVVDRIEVQSRNFGGFPFVDLEEFIMNESIACEICMSGDDEETLLLCDLCNLGYHMACLNPPLDAIPAGSWYCPPCSELHALHSVNRNLDEVTQYVLNNIPLNRLAAVQTSARTVRTRPMGPLPRGRGPTLNRRMRTHSIGPTFTPDMIASVLHSHLGNQNTINAPNSSVQSARQRIKSRKRNRRRARRRVQVPGIRVEIAPQRVSARTDDVARRTSFTRPGAAMEMVFPSFNLFDNDADYYSEEDDTSAAMEGEVAIMARVRSEYSARRVENRKNMVSSILNNYGNRISSSADVPEITPAAESSISLLDSILESQTLWHSKNVEITSQKDGKLEVKLKNQANKPDLTNTNHTSKEIPLYPNKNGNSSSSGNKSYTNNTRYSNNLGNSSAGGSNSFPLSSSSFTSLNPSTRPGFSNILGNSSSALDLSPFRGTAPIRFRMNPPRSALRRQNFNTNSMRFPAGPNSALNLSQSPHKGNSGAGVGEDDVDLYDDIESENVESDKINEGFSSLEPPPEPPALLIGSDTSSDEDNGLVIDDKVAHAANKSNIYDPTEPNEDSDIDGNEDKDSSIVPGYLRSPSYGGLSEFGPHLPLPEPPALPIELGSVNSTDDEDEDDDDDDEAEAECPNMTLYSSTSIINLANNVQDIPVPPAQPDDLDCIPVPNPPPGEGIPLPDEQSSPVKPKEPPPLPLPQSATTAPPPPTHDQLYSPSAEHVDSDSSDLVEEVPVSSSKSSLKRRPRRRSSSSGSSLGSSDENGLSSDDEGGRRGDESDDYESDKDETNKRVARLSVSSDSSRCREPTDTKKVSRIEKGETVDLTETLAGEPSKNDSTEVDDIEVHEKTESDTVQATSVDVEKSEGENDDKEDDGAESATVKRSADTSVEEDGKDEANAEVATEVELTAAEAKKSDAEDDASKSAEAVEAVAEVDETGANKESAEAASSNTCLLPSDDLDPVSDIEYNDFTDYHKHSSATKDRRKKRKKTKKREHSVESTASLPGKSGEARELEEGEIADDKSKRKYSASRKHRRSRSLSADRFDKKLSKRRNRRDRKAGGKENKDAVDKAGKEAGSSWKKLSKSTKDRNYRDGKPKSLVAEKRSSDVAVKSKELRSKKEKRKEIERYDVRKIVSEKPARPVRDEFGRDISQPRSRSRSRSPRLRSRSRSRSHSRSVSAPRSYSDRRRSKGPFRRSFSQDDRLIDWSPMWTQQQRRSRSRTRRTRSRSRNRSRLSGDRYRNRSKNRDRPYEKRSVEEGGRRKRRRSLSSNLDRYSPVPVAAHEKKRRRSKEHQQQRMRKSTSYTNLRHHGASGAPAPAEYFYEQRRSWSPNVYASMTPEPEAYVTRYERSPPPSMMEAPSNARLAVVSPDPDIIQVPNPQNLTVIVPNVDAGKKKHKKKKDGKKKKKKQPSKEVFTSGDNIVVSVNFDDNQKIISAKSSKRKHDEGRKKKRDETRRKKRKQTLHVSDEVLNAKPVAVIDLNTSPCKEMSPTEVISLTDSGDEANVNEGVGGGSMNVISVVRRTSPQQYEGGAGGNEVAQTPDGMMSYVMTSAGPKTPPEPHIKFTVGAGTQMRPLANNPIFEQDEELENDEEQLRYNKGPNTPPEPLEQQRRRSDSPGATMYDPFEPTKSRSPSPVASSAHYDKSGKDGGSGAPVVIDMFADDTAEKGGADGGAGGEASGKKSDGDCVDGKSPAVKTADEASQTSKTSPPTKEASAGSGGDGTAGSESTQQTNGMNTLVLDLSSLGDDFVPRSSVPLIKTSQGKYEFQSSKAADKPVTVVIAPQSSTATPIKPQPQQVMVTPTRQLPMKPVEPIKQPIFPDILPWKLPPPMSQPSFAVPSTMVSSVAPTLLNASKNMPGMLLNQNGGGGGGAVDDTIFELDDSPYSPASSEGDELFEPPPLGSNAALGVSPKVRGPPAPVPAVNSYKSRVDALFNSSPAKKLPPRPAAHGSRSYPAFKTTAKKATKTVAPSKKDPTMKADEEQLKILDDVPNSAVEMIVKEKFLKKLHRQERVVEEVKVVLKPHYAKKHITKEEYKDILRKAVPKICHNKSGDINPSKIQGLVEAYVRKIRHSKKKKPSNTLPLPGSTGAPLFPSMSTAKTTKKQKTLWS